MKSVDPLIEHVPVKQGALLSAICAVIATCSWFALTWRYGFDLADEGYLWYGAQRALLGEIPIRDFMSYDIGRYYWSAAIMAVVGDDGIFAIRLAALTYQCLGTVVGVYLVMRAAPANGSARFGLAILVAVLLTIWVHPYYKVFDHATSVFVVALLVLMASSRRCSAWFVAGGLLGLAAVMGRNHGVYGAVAASMLLVWLLCVDSRRTPLHLVPCFIAGVAAGFSPVLLMMGVVPGFYAAFIESVLALLRSGATNIALPVPWPWLVNFAYTGIIVGVTQVVVGIAFLLLILLPVFVIINLLMTARKLSSPGSQLLLASALAGAVYSHYAYARADVTHLALAIFPLLLATCALLLQRLRWSWLFGGGALLVASSVAILSHENVYFGQKLFGRNLATVKVTGHDLETTEYVAKKYGAITVALERRLSDGGVFLAVPDMPSIYAVRRAKMPIWEIYSLFPRDAAFERAELARLAQTPPELVIISNHALDGRPDFRYEQMHPLLYAWISENFEEVASDFPSTGSDLAVMIPRR
ncbi:MAG: hypothetical protein ACK4S6_01980 [Roseateles asaccharophilus]|uniref:hypothetical protein n=1 Tax=Roseateles asaccharophilus TaxID=582607 RepID=UPI00391D339B